MIFQCINIRQVPWEVLKTAAFGLGFQHLPLDLANVNAWKTMFDPYSKGRDDTLRKPRMILICTVFACSKAPFWFLTTYTSCSYYTVSTKSVCFSIYRSKGNKPCILHAVSADNICGCWSFFCIFVPTFLHEVLQVRKLGVNSIVLKIQQIIIL